MEFKDVMRECETCEYLYTRKDHMPCCKCRLNKLYISHWKAHPAIARAFGETVEYKTPVFHMTKKEIEEAVEKANSKLVSDEMVPIELTWTDPLRNPTACSVARAMTDDEMKGEDDGVSEETENQEV